MNPQQIMDAILKTQKDLSDLNTNYRNFGIQRANAERKYKMELRKKLLELRIAKTPSNIIQDVAKGDEYISKLRLDRDLAENNYSSCKEAMNNKRLELESLRSFLTWMRAELGNS